MEGEVSISQCVDKLIATKLSLTEVLGKDWKEKCIFDSPDHVFTAEELEAIKNKQKVAPENAQTIIEKTVVQANNIFTQNQSSYNAELIVSPQEEQQLLISGNIGEDTIYMLSRFCQPVDSDKFCIMPEKIGIMTKDNKLFSIDGILRSTNGGNNNDNLLIIEKTGEKFSANMHVSSYNSLNTITHLPETYDEMGAFAHELGHLLRKRVFRQDSALREASNKAHDVYTNITANTFAAGTGLDPYQVRQAKANEERGAWALGISLFQEVGKEIGISCGSKVATARMLERAEKALSTYDTLPYVLESQKETELIPTFSQNQKKASRELQIKLQEKGVQYSQLPNFDQDSGENLANKPTELLKIVQEK